MTKSYYDILGVSKNASKDEIKKAFRKLSKEHHPDKGGDEKKFKEISQAYEVLSDDQKKAQYDQFGSAGPGFGGGGGGAAGGGFSGGFSSQDFGGFEDIFSSFFGGGGGMGGARSRPQYTRGADLEVAVELDFDEAMKGVTKTFTSRNLETCEECKGAGGFDQKNCSQCAGSGMVSQQFQTPFGQVAQQAPCPSCKGRGKSFERTCSKCQGEGRVQQKKDIKIKIPAGVDDGETLKIPGQGEAGRHGGSHGDLYAHIQVQPSSKFHRRGNDLLSTLKISVFDAILGGTFEIETFWGKVDLKVPENTRDGQFLQIKGKGVHRSGHKGDHLVKVEYEMPKKVSGKLKELLESAKKQ